MENALAKIVGSRIRAEIFRLLFTGPEKELHVREIERRIGFNDRAIRQELAKLSKLHLLESRRDGNRLYYRACTENPVYPDIRNLALKTSGMADVLREKLMSPDIHVAFVFGSIAAGDDDAESDIDLMIIGQVGMYETTKLLGGASDVLGREINPYILTPPEFRKRAEQKEHFVTTVLAGPKIMIRGNESELARVGR